MTANHTPGPWVFVADGDANHYSILAAGRWLLSFIHNGEALTETQKANATLIVAAPDLLDALRLAEWSIGPEYEEIGPRCPVGACIKPTHRPNCPIGDAIAKAEGRPRRRYVDSQHVE